jgi:hypothetical protein
MHENYLGPFFVFPGGILLVLRQSRPCVSRSGTTTGEGADEEGNIPRRWFDEEEISEREGSADELISDEEYRLPHITTKS